MSNQRSAPKGSDGSKASVPALGALGELAQKGLGNATAVGRIIDGVKTVADAAREIAAQRTEQKRIRWNAQAEMERIHAVRDVLVSTSTARSTSAARTSTLS